MKLNIIVLIQHRGLSVIFNLPCLALQIFSSDRSVCDIIQFIVVSKQKKSIHLSVYLGHFKHFKYIKKELWYTHTHTCTYMHGKRQSVRKRQIFLFLLALNENYLTFL